MTLTVDDIEKINSMIDFAGKNMVIISPRFTDYRVAEILNFEQPDGTSETEEAGDGGIGGAKLGTGDIGAAFSASRGGNIPALLSRFAGFAGIAAPVASVFLIQPITEKVIDELQRPGGILDKRVKIDARNEAFAELDRQTRQNTRIGDRQVIIQQFDGFRNFEGHASTNTSRLIRENADRVLDIGLFDRAQGVT